MCLNFLNKSFLGDSGTLLISFILSFIFIKLFNNQIILNSDEILIYMLIPGIDMIRLFFLKELKIIEIHFQMIDYIYIIYY